MVSLARIFIHSNRYKFFIDQSNQDYQTVGFGNYGYGIYLQDVEVYRNPFTGRANIERDVDFIPLTGNPFRSYAGFSVAIDQQYHIYTT
jgi:hypothetical protein